jgi:ferrous-iron efflux pump FieF
MTAEADRQAKITPLERAQLMRRATYASVAVAVGLVAIKVVAWAYTGSVALLGSLFDSFLDALSSSIMLLAVSHALAPADADHRFGHGKVEAIAGLGQAALITGSALYLFGEAMVRFFEPQLPRHSDIGIVVIAVSMAATLLLLRYQRHVVAKTGSLAIGADSLHYAGDLLMNGGVVLVFMSAEFAPWPYADPVVGVAIAGILIRSSWAIARQSFDVLMDREMGDEERQRITEIVMSHREVRGIHDLRTRTSGLNSFIQFHIELDPDLKLSRAHRISDRVELAVAKAFPSADIIIHVDPEGLEMPLDVTPLPQEVPLAGDEGERK